VIGLLVGLSATSWTGAIEPQGGEGVFAGLKIEQAVALKDVGAACEVRVLDQQLPTGEEVAEIGVDYLGIGSRMGIETRILMASVKMIVQAPTR
jgi:hypothetical protein